MPRDIDPQAIDMRGSYPPPTTPAPSNLPCIGAEGGIMEGGSGTAAEGNAQMGVQIGGERAPGDASGHLGGW